MVDTRDFYIGARFTGKEKEYIEKIAEKRGISLSELLREALFSHLNFIKQFDNEDGKIELILISDQTETFEGKIKTKNYSDI
ncbi:MAG: ribbon-helix-helix protein, CopG family [Candidatus Lokiarchaeota archaeon]|nr:ribbon-helix-helix protein, CopG family [Candidatus Lokiarchaeota archaeon]